MLPSIFLYFCQWRFSKENRKHFIRIPICIEFTETPACEVFDETLQIA